MRKLLNQLKESTRIPLSADKNLKLESRNQTIVETKIIVKIPEGMFGKVHQPWGKTQFKPNVAPGIIILGHEEICVLVSNLQKHKIKVRRHQIISFLYLKPASKLKAVEAIGTLNELGIEEEKTKEPSVHAVISLDDLKSLKKSN